MKNLIDYIEVYDDIFSEDDIEELEDQYEGSPSMWEPATTVGKTTGYRVCDTRNLIPGTYIDNLVFKRINVIFDRLNEKYSFLNLDSDDGYKLLRYDSGEVSGKYDIHIDHGRANNRIITIIVFINDDYTGGELSFFTDLDYTVKPKRGRVVAFPSSFQYPHAVKPVLSGQRRTMITWGT